ncbi:MAG: RNA polymerase sigma factor [Candidatus Dadabacteria bacterium]|nr:RNA polymerase sigma factor [Candidatus Dadabacteria bacterium]NIS10063.1 RNA polymerase sigma factor [Candidatus Dadabacteria bacterium]NIV42140.1 sigma-70 family RNA polymerase sigma factor [Candidatus Dadabacteria bacterium]NIX16449.1 sigma-70 family RNA polymerase sigma factor [Candidatus Dadabacteria bacterium]NIY23010.1 sigma-70 family RNA polymerase sigma factor [Candidatus Dadabacteria bacterium]
MDYRELVQCGYRYALSLTNNGHDAEDLVQEAFVKIIGKNKDVSKTYFYKTIKSLFIDKYRRESLVLFDTEQAEQDSHSEDSSDEDLAMSAEHMEMSLEILRPFEREVLFLSAVEEYTAEEIAKMMDRPRGTVLSLIHRSKIKIRDKIRILEHKQKLIQNKN